MRSREVFVDARRFSQIPGRPGWRKAVFLVTEAFVGGLKTRRGGSRGKAKRNIKGGVLRLRSRMEMKVFGGISGDFKDCRCTLARAAITAYSEQI